MALAQYFYAYSVDGRLLGDLHSPDSVVSFLFPYSDKACCPALRLADAPNSADPYAAGGKLVANLAQEAGTGDRYWPAHVSNVPSAPVPLKFGEKWSEMPFPSGLACRKLSATDLNLGR